MINSVASSLPALATAASFATSIGSKIYTALAPAAAAAPAVTATSLWATTAYAAAPLVLVGVTVLPPAYWLVKEWWHRYGGIDEEMAKKHGKTPAQLVKDARTKHGIDCRSQCNVAIVGTSGCGKSSLINSITGKRHRECGAAEVGEVEQLTKLKCYSIPGHDDVKLWDTSGAGTTMVPGANHFDNWAIYAFDVIVIVYAERLTEIAWDIARHALEWKKPIAFVRSKSDQDQNNKADRESKEIKDVKQELKVEVRSNFVEELAKQSPPLHIEGAKFFYVSSYVLDGGHPRITAEVYGIDEEVLRKYFFQDIVQLRMTKASKMANAHATAAAAGEAVMATVTGANRWAKEWWNGGTGESMATKHGKNLKELMEEARVKHGVNCHEHCNVAVVGATGSGKSTLINSIIGKEAGEHGAAKVDEVEQTAVLACYDVPICGKLKLWDTLGTTMVPGANHSENWSIHAFDAIIIVYAGRITEIVWDIARNALQWEKPIIFVRSKSDQDIENRARREGKARKDLKEDVKDDVWKDFKENFGRQQPPLPLKIEDVNFFYVSAHVLLHLIRPCDYCTNVESEKWGLVDEKGLIKHILEEIDNL